MTAPRFSIPALVLVPAWAASAGAQPPAPPRSAAPPTATAQSAPAARAPAFARAWCTHCHGGDEPEADLDLQALLAAPPDAEVLTRLLDVRDMVRGGDMPPEDEPQPPAAARTRFVAAVERRLADGLHAVRLEPGPSPARRPEPDEYANTVHDLLGVDIDASGLGDEPAFSAAHLERSLDLAERIADAAICTEDPDHPAVRHLEAEEMHSSLDRPSRRGDFTVLYSRGTLARNVSLPRAGRYRLRVRAYGDQAGGEKVRMTVRLGARERSLEVAAERAEPAVIELELQSDGGAQPAVVSFTNDYYKPEPKPAEDRNLLVDWLEVVGPIDRRPPSAAQRAIFAPDPGHGAPATRARPIVEALASRAWRRPARADEVTRLAALVAGAVHRGSTFTAGIQLALQAVLVAPQFLLHAEPAVAGRPGVQTLDSWALAARLSYFLWRSSPDNRLRALAARGALRDPTVLVAEARRLLADRRADRLVRSFVRHSLELWRLDEAQPDPDRFPAFDDALRASMRRETELFVGAIVREHRSLRELVTADFTFVDAALASLYGLAGIRGSTFRRVQLADPRRGGLLGQASIQTLTSNPTRTSPVKRGKWVLDNLLDDPPAPPPANVPRLDEAEVTHPRDLREALALHRRDPDCAVCHLRMDALGFALEAYDAIGRWRDRDAGSPIDTSTTLPSSTALQGSGDLIRLAARDRGLVRGIAKKLFRLALAREPTADDRLALEALVAGLPAEATFEDLVVGLVQLDAFRRRRVD